MHRQLLTLTAITSKHFLSPHYFHHRTFASFSSICKFPKKIKEQNFAEKLPKSSSKKGRKKAKDTQQSDNDMNHNQNNRRILCVAEKNDAAKNIAKLLSKGWVRTENGPSKYNKNYTFEAPFNNANHTFVFTSVSGHLMNYNFSNDYKVWVDNRIYDLFDGQIILDVASGMRDIETNLKQESRKTNTLIIWTDCDREGEFIGNEIVTVCRKENRNLRVFRARFSEITDQAVTNALNNLVLIDRNSVDAVDCRMELDLRIGAAFTRLQTLYLRRNHHQFMEFTDPKVVISYGSCQFPTLGFVVERYKENKEFVAEEFWKLSGRDERRSVEFLWEREGLSTQIFDRGAAQALFDSCNAERNTAKVKEVDEHPKSRWRPLPMDTIQLEKMGSKHLKLTVKRVVDAAEKLYQQGYISYPRTETNIYPKDYDLAGIVDKMALNNEWGQYAREEIQQKGGPKPRNGRKSDQAHPPIHPVKNANKTDIPGPDEWRVYDLICRHFLACVSRDASGHETKVKVEVNEEIFTATGLVITDKAYLNVYPFDRWTDKELPKYLLGQHLPNFQIKMANGFTQAPPLLTEADLIALMDRKGIGTDATHAEHIEKIKQRQYVVLNRINRFEPTTLGLALIDGYDMMEHAYQMSKPDLRAALEADLAKICEGKKSKRTVLQEQLNIYKDIFRATEIKVNMLGESLRRLHQQQNNNGQHIR